MKLDTAEGVLEWADGRPDGIKRTAREVADVRYETAERLALAMRVLAEVEALAKMNEPGFRNILNEAKKARAIPGRSSPN